MGEGGENKGKGNRGGETIGKKPGTQWERRVPVNKKQRKRKQRTPRKPIGKIGAGKGSAIGRPPKRPYKGVTAVDEWKRRGVKNKAFHAGLPGGGGSFSKKEQVHLARKHDMSGVKKG